jgi:hypothetical protein
VTRDKVVYSLHPVTIEDVRQYVSALGNLTSDLQSVRRGSLAMEWIARGDSRGPDMLGHALASWLAGKRVSFAFEEICLTKWEAVIERGVGMLLRPPSRLFVDAGIDRSLAQRLPIRIDPGKRMMAGAYVPAHLMPQLAEMLEQRLERQLRRMRDAELDPVANMGLMLEAVQYARDHGTGLLEAADVVDGLEIALEIRHADRKRLPADLRKRLEIAAKPARRPGLMARLLGARQAAWQAQADARQAEVQRRIKRGRVE